MLKDDIDIFKGIPESHDNERPSDNDRQHGLKDSEALATPHQSTELEIQLGALRTALNECWTLCNTLAGLSSNHRSRIFSHRGKSEVQEQAWRSCWRLCQSLYESRDEDPTGLILPTLEMCREFCQALFEARQKGDPATDSILRVSFELNNHLYNTHDRNLPSAFQERTLDFYLTLCHRLMKQRTSLPEETDSLLRACWTLAELLFSLRQNTRERKPPDEELLGSAVQACWDLCDLFREGWNQVRPDRDRGTPRPSQGAFAPPPRNRRLHSRPQDYPTSSSYSARSSNSQSRSPLPYSSYRDPKTFPPETPTTIFDDHDPVDTDDDTGHVPNILVLGPDATTSSAATSTTASNTAAHHTRHASNDPNRWRSASDASSSSMSGFSDSSYHTSSTATASVSPLEAHLNRIRVLLIKTATNCGFQSRASTSPSSVTSPTSTTSSLERLAGQQNAALLNFVQAMPANSFGSHGWHATLLDKYKRLVAAWPTVVQSAGVKVGVLPPSNTSATSSPPVGSSASNKGAGGGQGSEAVMLGLEVLICGAMESPSPIQQQSPPLPQGQQSQTQSGSQQQQRQFKRPSPAEVARAVQWMMRSERNVWLGDLFRVVFGCLPGDAGALNATVMF